MEYFISKTIFGFMLLFITIIQYAVNCYPLYKMYKLANLKNPKIAFVPFIQSYKTYNLANFSMWYILLVWFLSFIPIIGAPIVVIISFVVHYKLFENFGFNPICSIIFCFIPLVAFWYIALTNKPFVGTLKDEYIEK